MEARQCNPLRKSILALFVLIPILALAGCQKGGDSTQPTAAVAASGGEKAESPTAAATEAPQAKSDQDLLHPVLRVRNDSGQVHACGWTPRKPR